jgi:thiol-disulfide isomerase/thioredoxin
MLMKHYFKITILIFISGFIIFVVFQMYQKSQTKDKIIAKIEKLPTFSFQTLHNKLFGIKDIPKSLPVLLIRFNSTCEHCQYEAKSIYENKEQLRNTIILMVSDETQETLNKFTIDYKLKELPNLYILKDAEKQFSKIFASNGIPDIFIYDATGKLKKHFKGETKMEAILKAIR